jgi:NTP pyrophosphatase (non-canonical NTP hydrolase)
MGLLASILILALAINTMIVWSVLRYFHRREIGKVKTELETKYRALIGAPEDSNLQWAIHAWHRLNFPDDDARDALLGVGEELGEVNRAQIKQSGGIRGSFEYWHQEKAKEIGDVLIGLINYCAWNDIDWLEALQNRWSVISRRDYIRFPEDGGRKINGEEE